MDSGTLSIPTLAKRKKKNSYTIMLTQSYTWVRYTGRIHSVKHGYHDHFVGAILKTPCPAMEFEMCLSKSIPQERHDDAKI